MTAMARPREFDRADALQKALGVFWQKGYAATSTGDLLAAMAIGRQSMYDTFGDKHALYIEAFRLYVADSIGEQLRKLRGPTPLGAVANMLHAFAQHPSAKNGMGCMGVNAVCEFGLDDPDVVQIQQAGGAMLQDAIEKLLLQARDEGELATSADPKAGAAFILSTLVGMKLSSKAGADEAALNSIAAFAMQGLKAG